MYEITSWAQVSVWLGAYFSLWRAAASSLLSWTNCTLLTGPEPLVVRSRVSSCISTGTPSAVKLRSSSTPVAPFLLAWSRKRQDDSFLCKTEIYWQTEKKKNVFLACGVWTTGKKMSPRKGENAMQWVRATAQQRGGTLASTSVGSVYIVHTADTCKEKALCMLTWERWTVWRQSVH